MPFDVENHSTQPIAMVVDPLSIAATSAALAQLCFKLSVAVNSFVGDVKSIDEKIQTLHQGLNALSQVLNGVSLAWTSNPEVAAAQSGPDGALWVSVKDSIARCAAVLKRFEQLLNRVSTENGTTRSILKRGVSKIKLSLNMNDVDSFRAEIDIYHRVLVIALNSINTCAILRRGRTDAEVSQRLETIEAGIDGLAQQLGNGQTSSLVPGSEAANTLKGFLDAASAFRTSASTFSNSGSTVRGETSTVRGGSVFGEPLSEDRLNRIKTWIPAPLDEGSEGSTTEVASSSGWSGSVQDVESLPQLMSVLENVAQMADRFQALEKQKHFTKDEEIRVLREKFKEQEKMLSNHSAELEKTEVKLRQEYKRLLELKETEIQALKDENANLISEHTRAEVAMSEMESDFIEGVKRINQENKHVYAKMDVWKRKYKNLFIIFEDVDNQRRDLAIEKELLTKRLVIISQEHRDTEARLTSENSRIQSRWAQQNTALREKIGGISEELPRMIQEYFKEGNEGFFEAGE